MKMIDLKGNSERLKLLKGSKKNGDAKKFVHEMLGSKFEGQQSLAIQVLGSWGMADDKEAIKGVLLGSSSHYHRTVVLVAIHALGNLITPKDSSWLLDSCFALTEMTDRHFLLLHLFPKLTPETTREFLVHRLISSSELDRWAAARAIMAIRFPDQEKLLRPLLQDSDRWVRETAKAGIQQAKELPRSA
jgi:hypothetical protein